MAVQTIGALLMVVGTIGLVLSFILASSWGRKQTVVVRDESVTRDRYDDEDVNRAA